VATPRVRHLAAANLCARLPVVHHLLLGVVDAVHSCRRHFRPVGWCAPPLRACGDDLLLFYVTGVGLDDIHFALAEEVEEITRATQHKIDPSTGEVQFSWTTQARRLSEHRERPMQLRRMESLRGPAAFGQPRDGGSLAPAHEEDSDTAALLRQK